METTMEFGAHLDQRQDSSCCLSLLCFAWELVSAHIIVSTVQSNNGLFILTLDGRC